MITSPKIIIDAQRLLRTQRHGIEIFCKELLQAINAQVPQGMIEVWVRKGENDDILHQLPNLQFRVLDTSSYPVYEQGALPYHLTKRGFEGVLHCTGNTMPLHCPVPFLLTLHDGFFMKKPQNNGRTAYQTWGNRYRKFVVPRGIKKAQKVVTVSHTEKIKLVHQFNLAPESVAVIYNGCSDRFREINDHKPLIEVLMKYHLPTNFILAFANTDPKKNTDQILRAFARIYHTQPHMELVLVNYTYDRLVQKLSALGIDANIAGRIRCMPYIPHQHMPALYNLADLFLFPSLDESFGLPLIEAMACGTPVVTSNSSCLPEIAGMAAELVDPNNPDDIAAGVNHVLENEDHYHMLVQRGLARRELFTWQHAATQYLELYEQVHFQSLITV